MILFLTSSPQKLILTVDGNPEDEVECKFEEGIYLSVFIVYILLMKYKWICWSKI